MAFFKASSSRIYVQAQDASSIEDLLLGACLLGVHGVMNTRSKERFPHGYGEAIRKSSSSKSKQEQSRKVFHLEGDKIIYIKLKWDA